MIKDFNFYYLYSLIVRFSHFLYNIKKVAWSKISHDENYLIFLWIVIKLYELKLKSFTPQICFWLNFICVNLFKFSKYIPIFQNTFEIILSPKKISLGDKLIVKILLIWVSNQINRAIFVRKTYYSWLEFSRVDFFGIARLFYCGLI